MKKLVINLVYFVTLFIFMVVVVWFMERKYMYNNHYFELPKDKKYIMFGHSHPECAFNDSLIHPLFNLGRSGESYFYTYLKAKKIIESNAHIDTIFIEYTNNQLFSNADNWIWSDKYMHYFLPLMLPSIEYAEAKLLLGKNPAIFLSTTASNFKNLFRYRVSVQQDRNWGGYLYLEREEVASLTDSPVASAKDIDETTNILSVNIEYLKKIIAVCNQNKKKVFLIRSPLHSKYRGLHNELQFKNTLKTLFKEVEFLDFKDFPLKDAEFGDLEHLNFKGARKISIFFDYWLKQGLLQKENKQFFLEAQFSKMDIL